MGVKKSNKKIKFTRWSVTSQNNAKNEQQVTIHTVITLLLLIPFFVL